jgi:hypothetical protein
MLYFIAISLYTDFNSKKSTTKKRIVDTYSATYSEYLTRNADEEVPLSADEFGVVIDISIFVFSVC